VAGNSGKRIGFTTVDEIGSGLNRSSPFALAVPTFSGRSISIKRCVDRANSPFCIDILATAAFRNRIGAVLRGPEITGLQQPCDVRHCRSVTGLRKILHGNRKPADSTPGPNCSIG